jgi:hypothetical protein
MPEHNSIPASPPPPDIGKDLNNKSNPSSPSFSTNKFQWANQFPEVQRACFFAKICEDSRPKKCVVHQIEPILQNGPVCGLVCIAMISSKNAETLLHEAKLSQYSNNGEMFSAYYLFKLLEKQNINCNIYYHDGYIDSDLIKNKLKKNCMLLVPYPFF